MKDANKPKFEVGDTVYIWEYDTFDMTEEEFVSYDENYGGNPPIIKCTVIREKNDTHTEIYRHDIKAYELWENSKLHTFDETNDCYSMSRAIDKLEHFLLYETENAWDSHITCVKTDFFDKKVSYVISMYLLIIVSNTKRIHSSLTFTVK